MLPFFFRHYDHVVTRYHILDNGSTDGGLELVAAHPRAELLPFEVEGDSFERYSQRVLNEVWKRSRGRADWVIVCDIDEQIWHPQLPVYLKAATAAGVTAMRPEAFEMVAADFPETERPLSDVVTCGFRRPDFDKLAFFNPDAIEETGFGPGRHSDALAGRVVHEPRRELLLLHYKKLGPDYLKARHRRFSRNRRPGDIAEGLSAHWSSPAGAVSRSFESYQARSSPVPGLLKPDKG